MTQKAMKYAYEVFRETKRPNVPQVLMVMTDGVMQNLEARKEAIRQHKKYEVKS